MEREILFRGKRIDNGEWVYGLLSFVGTYNGKPAAKITDFECEEILVFPKTCGEYTGLTDRNGKKIFEGDIIKHNVMYADGKTIKREDQFFEIRYSIKQIRFLAYLPNGVFNPTAMQNCEVIGNIHDNPEMVEGEGNE